MPRRYPQPVFLDATVLSNFASSDAVGFLETILDSPVVVPAVRDEIERGQNLGHEYLTPAVDAFDDELPVGDRPAEDAAIRKRLDAGEAAALRGALEREGTLATDDLAARRLADELSVPVTGSIGLLVLGIERDQIDQETADGWLDVWRTERGYFAPVESVSEIVDEDE